MCYPLKIKTIIIIIIIIINFIDRTFGSDKKIL